MKQVRKVKEKRPSRETAPRLQKRVQIGETPAKTLPGNFFRLKTKELKIEHLSKLWELCRVRGSRKNGLKTRSEAQTHPKRNYARSHET